MKAIQPQMQALQQMISPKVAKPLFPMKTKAKVADKFAKKFPNMNRKKKVSL